MNQQEREDPTIVFAEFRAFLNDMAGAEEHARLAVDGHVLRLQEIVAGAPPNPENAEPSMHIGIGDPNLPTARAYQVWRFSELPAKGAFTKQWIGQQWIVGVFAGWDEEYRPRMSSAFGCPPESLTHDALGDLRLMRNDILHHRGVASRENTGRCRLLRWCAVGDEINVEPVHVADFMNSLPEVMSPD